MLLGKRRGPPIRRTTSMVGITVDPKATIEASQPFDHQAEERTTAVHRNPAMETSCMVGGDVAQHYFASPRKHQKCNSLVMENVNDNFLRTCSLCHRHLRHNRDIYMYRGDKAFCSLECREKQIKLDERKTENGVVSSKQVLV